MEHSLGGGSGGRHTINEQLNAAHKGVQTILLDEEPTFPLFEYADILASADFGDWRDDLVTKGYVNVAAPRRHPGSETRLTRESAMPWSLRSSMMWR